MRRVHKITWKRVENDWPDLMPGKWAYLTNLRGACGKRLVQKSTDLWRKVTCRACLKKRKTNRKGTKRSRNGN